MSPSPSSSIPFVQSSGGRQVLKMVNSFPSTAKPALPVVREDVCVELKSIVNSFWLTNKNLTAPVGSEASCICVPVMVTLLLEIIPKINVKQNVQETKIVKHLILIL